MPHIGLLTPAYTGHVDTMITIGGELVRRGHRASVISTPDALERVIRNDLEFIPVGAAEFPVGSLERFTDSQARLSGMRAIQFTVNDLRRQTAAQARDLPDAVQENGIEALVVDQVAPIGSVVAQRFDIPFVSVCSLLPLNSDVDVPPWTTPWPYEDSNSARIRNRIGYQVRHLVERKFTGEANRARAGWGMKPVTADGSFSKLAQIAQIPAFFDFPRRRTPECFHYAGPLHDYNGLSFDQFPWEALDGRPLIYASMGAPRDRTMQVLRSIAEACVGLDAQLVISLGSRGAPIPYDLPGNPLVVDYAPQFDLLKRTSLVVTHGGMNTVMESMAHGVPMVILPVTSDQPGVAARAKRLGVAEFIPVNKVNAGRLRKAIEAVHRDPRYRENARKYQNSIREVDAVGRAADIVEEAFRTRRPVLTAAGAL